MSSVSPPRTLNGFELETFEDDLLTYENEDLTARIRFNGPAWLVELGEIFPGADEEFQGRILDVAETADDGIEILREITDAPLRELRQRARGMGDFAPTLNIRRETGGNITGRQQAVLEETFRSTDEIAALTNDQLLSLPRIGEKTVETIRREFGGTEQSEEFDAEEPDEVEGEDLTVVSGIGESFAMDIAEQTGVQTLEELQDTLWRNPESVTSVPRIQWGTVIEDALDPVSRSPDEFGLREEWEVWGLYYVRQTWEDGGPSLEEIEDLDMFENGYVNASNTVSVVGPNMDPSPDVERERFSITPDFALHTETVVPRSSDITDNESIVVFDSPEAEYHSTIGYDLLETAEAALGYDPIDRKQLWGMAEESDFPILLDDSGGRFSVFVAPRILKADSTSRDSFVDELEQNARDVIDDVGLPGRDLIPTMRSRLVVEESEDTNFTRAFYTTEGNLVPFAVKQEVIEEAEERFGTVEKAEFEPGTIVGSFAFKGRELLDTSFDPRDPPTGSDEEGVVTVVSEVRPLPRSARDELEEYGIIDTREVGEPGHMEEVDLEERPPDELLERFELSVEPGEPIETWVTDRGKEVRIFANRVISEEDGELGIEPEEAARQARGQDRFEPVMVPADSPLVDDGSDEEQEEDGDTVALPDRVDEGRWDVAVVVRPDNDFRERHEARLLPDSERKKPSVEVGEETIEEIENDAQGIPAWQYDDGDVVAVYAVRDGARGGVRIQAQSYSPGVDLLRGRTTDDSGNLTVTTSDGWVGIHPESLLDADVGDLSAGWVTAPIKANDSRSTFHVGWEGERAYHYRELREPPYFVYEFDRDEEWPDLDDTLGPGGGNPPTKRRAAVYPTPANDEVIGLEPRSDEGPKPGVPIFASEFEAEYDLDPVITSGDDVSEIIEKDILIRTPGGFLHETTATTETVRGTGFRVPDRVAPDGVWYVPTSSKSGENTIELVGVRDESFAAEGLPDDLLNATVTGESEASVALVQEMFPVLSDAQARDFAGLVPGVSVEEALKNVKIGTLTESAEGIGVSTVNEMLGTDDWETNQTLFEALERDISEGVADEIIQAARDFETDVPGEVVVSQDGERYVLDIEADVPQERIEELQNNAEAVVGPASAFSPGEVVGEFVYDRVFDTVSDLDPTVDKLEAGEDGFSGLITVAADPDAETYISDPPQDGLDLAAAFVDEVRDRFGPAENFVRRRIRGPRAVALAVVEDGEIVERDFTGGEDYLQGRVVRAEPELTPNEVRESIRAGTQGVTVQVRQAFGDPIAVVMMADGSVDMDRDEIKASGVGDTRDLVRIAVGEWAISADQRDVDVADLNEERERVNDLHGLRLPMAEEREGDSQERVEDDDQDGELSFGEVETIVEQATAGIRAEAFAIGDNLQEIRVERDNGVTLSQDSWTIVSEQGDSREGMTLRAVGRWGEFVDPTSVDSEAVNGRREALNRQFDIDIPMMEQPMADDTDDTDGVQESQEDDVENIPEALGRLVSAAMEAAGFPQAVLPGDVRVEGGSIVVDTTVDDGTFGQFLEGDLPIYQQGREDDEEFFVGVLNDIAELMKPEFQDDIDLSEARDVLGVGGGAADTSGGGQEETGVDSETQIDFRPDLPEEFADVIAIAMNQSIPKEEREMKMAKRLEESGRYGEEVPGLFTDAAVSLTFPRGGVPGGREFAEEVDIELGGSLSQDAQGRLHVPGFMMMITARGALIDIDSVWDNFTDLVKIVDPDSNEFSEIARKLGAVMDVTQFNIREGNVDWEAALLSTDTISEIARRSGDMWRGGFLGYMKSTSGAWWAAQKVVEARDNPDIRRLIEQNELKENPARGTADWYLEQAWKMWNDLGERFDPALFVEDYHNVFKPGESESEATQRRGEVDLDALGRPGRESDPTPDKTPGQESVTDQAVDVEMNEPDGDEDGTPSIADLADDIRDRM